MEEKRNSMKQVLISVIIPIYNVEQYLEECLISVANQTYQNIEVIMINDGSTDGSEKICKKWEKQKDFRYIFKLNEGLGPTRNLGVEVAKGEYVTFLDSDDFLSKDAIQELVNCLENKNYPEVIMTSSYYELDNITNIINQIQQRESFETDCIEKDNEVIKRRLLLNGFCMAWGKLYNREFLIRDEIKMPPIPHEDNAVFPQVIFGAERIGICNTPIYYYRVNRKGSIIAGGLSRQFMSEACECFMIYLTEKNLLKQYYAVLKRYIEIQLRVSYEKFCKSECDKVIQEKVLKKFELFYRNYFGEKKKHWEYEFEILGGFGVRGIVQGLGWNTDQLQHHYPFSSIIAQMTEGNKEKYSICCENVFRLKKIEDDIVGSLKQKLKEKDIITDFFFIDFIEERYDIAQLEDGNYITLSEAFFNSKVEGIEIKREIKSDSKEFMELWKEKCQEFVILLKENFEESHIILIESKLATCYLQDNQRKEYSTIEEIQKINQRLEEMYGYFKELFDNKIQVYSYSKDLYSLKQCRYGSGPQYLSDDIYKNMREEIKVMFDF